MSTNIVNTFNGIDFSSLKAVILCNELGEALNNDGSSSGVQVVNTFGGTDLSSLRTIIICDTNGQSAS